MRKRLLQYLCDEHSCACFPNTSCHSDHGWFMFPDVEFCQKCKKPKISLEKKLFHRRNLSNIFSILRRIQNNQAKEKTSLYFKLVLSFREKQVMPPMLLNVLNYCTSGFSRQSSPFLVYLQQSDQERTSNDILVLQPFCWYSVPSLVNFLHQGHSQLWFYYQFLQK